MTISTPYSFAFSRALENPVISAVARRCPGDFQVVEELGFEPGGTGEHVFLKVRKTGANTAWVAAGIARYAGVRPFDVSYAGKKDRHAVTTQWFSCWLPGKHAPDWQGLDLEGVSVLSSTRHHKKLRRGGHAGNRFRIRLKSVSQAAGASVVADRVDFIRTQGFPNYFGEQRFGHDGNNLHAAAALFAGKRVERSKRDLFLSAARSYLFNCALSRRVDDGRWLQEPHGWLVGESRTGEAACDPDDDPWGWSHHLARLGLKAMRRPWAIQVPDLAVAEPAADELELTFSLPSGVYATSLLRELVDYNTEIETGDLTLDKQPDILGVGMTSQRTRNRLIARLRERGIDNETLLDVLNMTPRHLFIDEALAHRAYEDTSLPIGFNQTISQPYTVARMTGLLLEDGPLTKVLEIGTGCGYQTAVLAKLVGKVYTVERIQGLMDRARDNLKVLGIRNVLFKHDDGNIGWSEQGPFDGIIVTASPRVVPQELIAQLKIGGRMIVPVGTDKRQELTLVHATREGIQSKVLEEVHFVPLLGGRS